jgi:hypothetical protein
MIGADRKNVGLLERTRRTGNKRTENKGINIQGMTGKMGDTWRGVETSTRTGETYQGVKGVQCSLTFHESLGKKTRRA